MKKLSANIKNKFLKSVENKINESGFKIYEPILKKDVNEDGIPSWFYYTDGKHIGYVQLDFYSKDIFLSSVYKPSKNNGSGAVFKKDLDISMLRKNLLKENLTFYFRSSNNPSFYENFKEFEKNKNNSWLKLKKVVFNDIDIDLKN